MEIYDVSAWLVWILPLVSCLFVPLIGRFSAKARNGFVLAVTAVTAFLAFTLIPAVMSGQPYAPRTADWIPGLSAGVYLDPLSVLFACLVGFFGLIIAIYSMGYMKHEENLTRYYFFLTVFVGSMIGLVVSDNFLQMFIFWEMVGMCSYALISFWNNRPESVKAGNKVFLMTRIGDVMLLGAIGILFASFGTFSFHGTIAAMTAQATAGTLNVPLMVTAAFLVLGGAVAKSAQLPLFTWLYSAMEAPTSVSALLHAATMVKAGIYLVARWILIAAAVAPVIAALQPLWFPTVAWIGVLTALVGATLALRTPDIKGVLAYSTVSQLGFMLAALGTALTGPASTGWFASLFHTMSHAFFEGLGFLLAGGIIHALGTRDMRLMGGLRKAMPITFALAIVMVITTAGLPPFAAYFSKGLVLESLMANGTLIQVILLFATTMITFIYSFRFLKLVFLGNESEHLQKLHPHEAPKIMLAPAIALTVACIVWGFLGPWLGGFMGVEESVSLLGAFTSLEAGIFALLIIPAALLVYVTYWKNNSIMAAIRSDKNPIAKLLEHGYFFDGFYERAVTPGFMAFSRGVKTFEVVVLEYFPVIFANGVVRFAGGVHKYFDVAADQLLIIIAGRSVEGASKVKTLDTLADKLLDAISRRTVRSSAKARKAPVNSLQHYLAAALVGFIMLVILIIISVRGI
jgi:NADH-quinone oxidoreductase subunit L